MQCKECNMRAAAGPHYDPRRATGRTGRQLVLAVSAMLMSQTVVYVSANSAQAGNNCRRAVDWLRTNGFFNQDAVPIEATGHSITMTIGSIKFVGCPELTGCHPREQRPGQVVITDHHVEELLAEREAKRLRLAQFLADQTTIFELMRKHKINVVRVSGSGEPYVNGERAKQG